MILIFLFIVGLLIYIEYKRTKLLFNYYNLFLLYWFMYTVGVYLSEHTITSNNIFATYLILTAGFFFIVGYYFIPFGVGKFKQQKKYIKKKTPNLSKFLILLTLFSLFLFFYVVIFKIGFQEYFFTSRANRSLITRPYSTFMVFIDLFNIITVLSLFLYLNTKKNIYKKIFIIVFFIAIVHAILTISRNNLVLVLVPTIYLLHYYDYIKSKMILIIVTLGISIAIIWKVLLFNIIIGDSFSFQNIIDNVKFPREFIVWQEISDNILQNNISLSGKSYIDTFVNLFYPFHYADNLSLWYVKNYEPHTFAIGGGRGFSNILEAYINFDVIGVILFFFFFGIIIFFFQRKSMNSIYLFVPYAFSLAFVHRIFRSDFMSLIKTWWWMYFLSFLFLFLLFKLIKKKEKNENYFFNKQF